MNEPRIEHSTQPSNSATVETYYSKHKAARDLAHNRWIAKNREKWNAYRREWRRKNRDRA